MDFVLDQLLDGLEETGVGIDENEILDITKSFCNEDSISRDCLCATLNEFVCHTSPCGKFVLLQLLHLA